MTIPADNRRRRRIGRRHFLGALGATAATAAGGIGANTAHAHEPDPDDRPPRSDFFGRIFHLPPFAEPSQAVKAALLELGRPGGLLDANDALDKGPVLLITDLSLSVNNPNNPNHTAGTTFVGQFMDHDMTFDATSRLGVATVPRQTRNVRTPAFDLDSVYGGGPFADPHLYEMADHAKLRVESGGLFEDLPRAANMSAIIGDPRNDEHLIIAGLHLAVMLFHNHVVDRLRSERGATRNHAETFVRARQLTTWHYQWLILHEFLPLFVGQPLVDKLLNYGRKFYTPRKGEAFIPVDFSGAAYRFGHSMIRPSYRANLAGDQGKPFFGLIFDPASEGSSDPSDLRGGARAPRRFVGWHTFFDFGDGQVKPNKRIDTKISTPLFHLPLGAIASHDPPTSLPQRTLLRHLTWQLPAGQRIAREMGAPVLSRHDLEEVRPLGVGFDERTPLWYYILREAELLEDGLRLGPVGGRIVGEVILGLLQTDPAAYLTVEPTWQPSVPTRGGSAADFRMVDFLTFAGVSPASRGQ